MVTRSVGSNDLGHNADRFQQLIMPSLPPKDVNSRPFRQNFHQCTDHIIWKPARRAYDSVREIVGHI